MKKMMVLLLLAFFASAAAVPAGALHRAGDRGHNHIRPNDGPGFNPGPRPDRDHRPNQGQRPHQGHGPRPHPGPRPGPPPYRHHFYYYDPGLWLWFAASDWANNNSSESYTVDVSDTDGAVVIVPNSPSQWQTQVDAASGTFAMSADLILPAHIRSDDVSSIRSVFNDAVERKSISTVVDRNFSHISTTGRIGGGRGFGSVALLQLVLERTDGRTYVQNIDIGLR